MFVSVVALVSLTECSDIPQKVTAPGRSALGALISSRTTMVTAWEIPKNPLTDPTLDDSRLSREIRSGFRIFTNTRAEAARFTPGRMSCNNCHLNAGQREKSLPLVGVTGMFPEYNRRAGRLFSLGDRIVDCFLRSQNATDERTAGEERPSLTSREVLAVSAYLTWLSQGFPVGKNPPWRGQNTIAASSLIPIGELEPAKGDAIFTERCITCHGADGQGVAVGDKKPGPLWGPDSWNDGAGAARVYTLAGIIRYSMPYLGPGSLDRRRGATAGGVHQFEAAACLSFQGRRLPKRKVAIDSVYYPQRK